ncbi:Uncharacterised protein [Mycobacterium tuberculosis]|nr:Uncharacterised protein [Mycobacterium tuberculosis]
MPAERRVAVAAEAAVHARGPAAAQRRVAPGDRSSWPTYRSSCDYPAHIYDYVPLIEGRVFLVPPSRVARLVFVVAAQPHEQIPEIRHMPDRSRRIPYRGGGIR